MSSAILGAGDTVINKIKSLPSWVLYSLDNSFFYQSDSILFSDNFVYFKATVIY